MVNGNIIHVLYCLGFIFLLKGIKVSAYSLIEDPNNVCTCTEIFSVCYIPCVAEYKDVNNKIIKVDMTP